MKVVTYNVNGLRQRVSQFGSLIKLLDSFDADIICFQETKLRRQELSADLVMADGYESFFSCTRTSDKGRTGYSGVATFCRVKSAFSNTEVALPVAAEEGFTGLVDNFKVRKNETLVIIDGLEEFEKDELLKVDSEGRCIITDHGHFVLFNVYGPRAGGEDTERIQFKLKFFEIMQKRWESLLKQGRRIFVVGDLNIAPTALDRCDAEPEFEKNEFRRWFRSMLGPSGGPFFDVFREKHPDRREAYTCWSSSTGAEQFNYGSRIDHILCTGSCLHQEHGLKEHNFLTCHVKECDILTEYKRWKPGNTPRWKGGWSIKLEGSDHAPVYMSLIEIPDIPRHSTPALSSRYLPMIHGLQQTLVTVLTKRQAATQVENHRMSSTCLSGIDTVTSCGETCSSSGLPTSTILKTEENSQEFTVDPNATILSQHHHNKSMPGETTKKKARKSQSSQLSLKSFFHRSPHLKNCVGSSNDISLNESDVVKSDSCSSETPVLDDLCSVPNDHELSMSRVCEEDQSEVNGARLEKEKNSVALLEWQRIQKLMQNSIPLCKGHKEPCVARIVKKPGPTFGRRFYVCARAEGPASNPEANCGYFKWASSKLWQK